MSRTDFDVLADEIAKLRDVFLTAVPAALDDHRFGEMIGSPWSVLQCVTEYFKEQKEPAMNPTMNLDMFMIDGVERAWLEAFEVSVGKHITFVQEAGDKLGVPIAQLAIHDSSKYSIEEFPHYARSFHGDRGDPVGFARAWLHHQNFNPHHWEYWMTRSDHSKGKSGAVNGCLEMPENYVREMVADWMGASMAYTGSWDMAEWCTKNLPVIQLHPNSMELVRVVLKELGYYCSFDAFANRYVVSATPFPKTGKAINYA